MLVLAVFFSAILTLMEFELPNTDILEHFALPIGIWSTRNQKFVFANEAAKRLFKTLRFVGDEVSVFDFIADVDYSSFQTNSAEYLKVLNMAPTSDEFPIPTEGFMRLRRADSTEFMSYIYIHDITDDLDVVRYRLIEIHTGYDELAENANWEQYFEIREKHAVAAFAGDIASQLNNGLAALPGMIADAPGNSLAQSKSLKILTDIAETLTKIADGRASMFAASSLQKEKNTTGAAYQLSPDHKRNRVLLVDDDLPLLEILTDLLTNQSMTVLTATSIADAMAIAESQPLDVALVDIRLGDENGRELATKLKILNKDLHVIYMTGYATSIQRIRRHENFDILKKPFTLEDALTAIQGSVD
jgi:CheY-like chemotaxis protein